MKTFKYNSLSIDSSKNKLLYYYDNFKFYKTDTGKIVFTIFIQSFVPGTSILEDDILGGLSDLNDEIQSIINYLETITLKDFLAISCDKNFNNLLLYSNKYKVFFFIDDINKLDTIDIKNLKPNTLQTAYKLGETYE